MRAKVRPYVQVRSWRCWTTWHRWHLYLLGDIFDAWLGDDDLGAPHMDILSAQRVTRKASRRASSMATDFLLGAAFTEQTGVAVLPESPTSRWGTAR